MIAIRRTASKNLACIILSLTCLSSVTLPAQPFDQALFAEMHWRCIGPSRGGRTVAISGIPSQPNVFYMAAVNGGGLENTRARPGWASILQGPHTRLAGADGGGALRPENLPTRPGCTKEPPGHV